ncbi:hypothetical protein CYLTODRAFT_424288 [Cylindrobasidium torrendii FP15055 ss-10]|uniref:Uncharacterized protein n=1 Tax=Cylindrobasidium torrendii FP15055 ss-10 TaxID=1314674 RepID=A0A0D7B0G2_9AGAR|nr:hypothetical protein CYLTODRAFT_425919 [Cylindrobasidium torrendii FP15055 ss-10]KIY65526.1 hypothetical protein CYLTODRAFT_424288 [Cylindrobasidium torrendii FP15055 ss-10]
MFLHHFFLHGKAVSQQAMSAARTRNLAEERAHRVGMRLRTNGLEPDRTVWDSHLWTTH